ncbi:hypothetical protein BV898_15525 [Hypsibius exemplaris]|uniref:Uncharacterized protein n=1 Tax=Hypsibius exemplaris TaxID=2072580 RepID=A0A9X6NE61_HYPEX|nr:hypothetical protein BV898_15525 [Hypsibius exemplaris]
MFVAEVCDCGKTRIRFIKPGAKIHSKYYIKKVLTPIFRDDMPRLFPGKLLKEAVFDHDSAPSHASKPTQDWLRLAAIRFIPKEDWMGNSPDRAPIDFCVLEEIRREIVTSANLTAVEFGGRRVAPRFMNRTFMTDAETESLTIDGVGERTVPMAVTQLDPATGKLSHNWNCRLGSYVIGLQIGIEQDAVHLKLRNKEQLIWPNVWPVPARPFCGFRGEASAFQKSAYSSTNYSVGFGIAISAIVVIFVLLRIR